MFTRRFVRTFVARIEGIDDADLFSRDDRPHWNNWIGNTTRVSKALLHDGIRLPGEGICKMFASLGTLKRK